MSFSSLNFVLANRRDPPFWLCQKNFIFYKVDKVGKDASEQGGNVFDEGFFFYREGEEGWRRSASVRVPRLRSATL